MAKRKASSPLEQHLNGDDEGRRREREGSTTPKRPVGTGTISSSNLNFVTPSTFLFTPTLNSSASTPRFKCLDGSAGEKMEKVNEAFVTNIASTLSEKPDALLFPLIESYVRHVHSILSPHLPPSLTAIDKDKGYIGFAKFMERMQHIVGQVKLVGGGGSRRMSYEGGSSSLSSSPSSWNNPNSKSAPSTPRTTTTSARNSPVSVKIEMKVPPTITYSSPKTPLNSYPPPYPLPRFTAKGDEDDKRNTVSNFNVPTTASSSPSTSTSSSAGLFMSIPSFNFNFAPPPAHSSNPPSTAVKTEGNDAQNDGEGEESEEPPKNEFVPVKEDDALYNIRCKVYGKFGGGFREKGVGQLYVKKSEAGKPYAVVRADNNLGTIILNIPLQKGLPVQQQGNSLLSCDPKGDNGNPLPILIRVKTQDAATELCEKFKEFRDQLS